MTESTPTPLRRSGERSAGPQGTRFFSTEALRQYASDAADAADDAASAELPMLEGSSPGIEGRRFAIRPGRMAIGRRLDNDIVIDDLSVSGCHAWITRQHDRCIIMNTLSTNGTFVNDRRIHEVTLRHGDHVRLGQAEFVFLTGEHAAPKRMPWRWLGAAAVLLSMIAGALAWWWLRSP